MGARLSSRTVLLLASCLALLTTGMLLLTSSCGGETTTPSAVNVPAEWTKYSGGGGGIYLPPTFDLNLKDPNTVESLQELGGEPAAWVPNAEDRGLAQWAIAVMDRRNGWDGDRASTLMVEHIETGEDISAQDFADREIIPAFTVHSRKSLTVDGREAAQILFDAGDGKYLSLWTFVKAPSGFWVIAFLAETSEMQAHLTDFQKSVSTFHISE